MIRMITTMLIMLIEIMTMPAMLEMMNIPPIVVV